MTAYKSDHRQLVLRVNELFHDLEGEDYENVHPEIFEREKARWDSILAVNFPVSTEPLRLLDIGSGTGFVVERLMKYIKSGDTVICADISDKMLEISQKKFGAMNTGSLKTLKMQDENIALPDASVDIITMNSVLHHIPDFTASLNEITRVLKPRGLLLIGHEPNNAFWKNKFLSMQSRVIHHLTPKRLAALILKIFGLYKKIIPVNTSESPILKNINDSLLQEGMTDHRLSQQELSALMDIHSPTAGSLHTDRGFDAVMLLKPWHDAYEIIDVQTYDYLSKMSAASPVHKLYDRLLRTVFPAKGSIFFLAARKIR